MGAQLDSAITKVSGEIERMAPNMKAMTKYVQFSDSFMAMISRHAGLRTCNLSLKILKKRPRRLDVSRKKRETNLTPSGRNGV